MKRLIAVVTVVVGMVVAGFGQQNSQPTPKPQGGDDFSGMYTFLREGEFVQVTREDGGKLSGFVSRYGDLDSDRGAFLDQFFKEGKWDGNHVSFTTETVHGVWYEFKGAVERGEGKNPGDEAYYVIKGTLMQYSTDANKKTTAKTIEVSLKEFPANLDSEPEKKE